MKPIGYLIKTEGNKNDRGSFFDKEDRGFESTLPLMPPVDLDSNIQNIKVRLRQQTSKVWSKPISLATCRYVKGKGSGDNTIEPLLVEIPGEPSEVSKFVWCTFSSVLLNQDPGVVAAGPRSQNRIEAWVRLEILPTVVFFNNTPYSLSVRLRPEKKWESIQHRMKYSDVVGNDETYTDEVWPVIECATTPTRPVSQSMPFIEHYKAAGGIYESAHTTIPPAYSRSRETNQNVENKPIVVENDEMQADEVALKLLKESLQANKTSVGNHSSDEKVKNGLREHEAENTSAHQPPSVLSPGPNSDEESLANTRLDITETKTAIGADKSISEEEVFTVGVSKVRAMCMNPFKPRVLYFGRGFPQQPLLWSTPGLRFDAKELVNLNVDSNKRLESFNVLDSHSRKENGIAFHKSVSVGIGNQGTEALDYESEDNTLVVQAGKEVKSNTNQTPVMCLSIDTPTKVENYTNRKLWLCCETDDFEENSPESAVFRTSVAPGSVACISWSKDVTDQGICMALSEEGLWSNPVPLSIGESNVVAVPTGTRCRNSIDATSQTDETEEMEGWVMQLWCETIVSKGPTYNVRLIIRNRICLHNHTGMDILVRAALPMWMKREDDFHNKGLKTDANNDNDNNNIESQHVWKSGSQVVPLSYYYEETEEYEESETVQTHKSSLSELSNWILRRNSQVSNPDEENYTHSDSVEVGKASSTHATGMLLGSPRKERSLSSSSSAVPQLGKETRSLLVTAFQVAVTDTESSNHKFESCASDKLNFETESWSPEIEIPASIEAENQPLWKRLIVKNDTHRGINANAGASEGENDDGQQKLRRFELFSCTACEDENTGVIHVALFRESQPAAVFRNHLKETVFVRVDSSDLAIRLVPGAVLPFDMRMLNEINALRLQSEKNRSRSRVRRKGSRSSKMDPMDGDSNGSYNDENYLNDTEMEGFLPASASDNSYGSFLAQPNNEHMLVTAGRFKAKMDKPSKTDYRRAPKLQVSLDNHQDKRIDVDDHEQERNFAEANKIFTKSNHKKNLVWSRRLWQIPGVQLFDLPDPEKTISDNEKNWNNEGDDMDGDVDSTDLSIRLEISETGGSCIFVFEYENMLDHGRKHRSRTRNRTRTSSSNALYFREDAFNGFDFPKFKFRIQVSRLHISLYDHAEELLHLQGQDVMMSMYSGVETSSSPDLALYMTSPFREYSGQRLLERFSCVAEACGEHIGNRLDTIFTMNCRAFQIDSHVDESEIPVIFSIGDVKTAFQPNAETTDDAENSVGKSSNEKIGKDWRRESIALHISAHETSYGKLWETQYSECSMYTAPAFIAVEDAVLHSIVTKTAPIAAGLESQRLLLLGLKTEEEKDETKKSFSEEKGSLNLIEEVPNEFPCPDILLNTSARKLYISSLYISDIVLELTLRTTMLPMFVGIDRTIVSFASVRLNNVFSHISELIKDLTANYIADALLNSPKLLGSLEILGNLTGLVRSMSAGVWDLFLLPLQEVRHGFGPGAVIRGVARGWASLFIHLSEGALLSVSGFSSSVARNLDRLSMDPNYLESKNRFRKWNSEDVNELKKTAKIAGDYDDEDDSPAVSRGGVTDGVARGLVGLGQGVVGAATGVVSLPIQSGMQNGWGLSGVLSGLGKGLVGVVLKPVGGAAEFVAQTSDGIMRQAGIGLASGPFPTRRKKWLKWTINTSLQLDWKILPQTEQSLFHIHSKLIRYGPSLALNSKGSGLPTMKDGDKDERTLLLVMTKVCLRVYLVGDKMKSHADLSLIKQYPWENVRIEEFRELPEGLFILSSSDDSFIEVRFEAISHRREFSSLALQRCLMTKRNY